MEISFFNPQDHSGNIKAAIQTSGKLGFTEAAIESLEISTIKGMKIGINRADPEDRNLYVVFVDASDNDAFRINKAGKYYYVNTKNLFDKMQLPYTTSRISFDIIEIEVNGEKMYKFIYKEKKKKS
jgi:hypothetical protein